MKAKSLKTFEAVGLLYNLDICLAMAYDQYFDKDFKAFNYTKTELRYLIADPSKDPRDPATRLQVKPIPETTFRSWIRAILDEYSIDWQTWTATKRVPNKVSSIILNELL